MIETSDVKNIIDNFEEAFNNRPLMLGNAVEVQAMFFIIDQLRMLVKYGVAMDSEIHTWHGFLIEKKLIREGRHELRKELMNNPEEFGKLQELRSEYYQWLDGAIAQ